MLQVAALPLLMLAALSLGAEAFGSSFASTTFCRPKTMAPLRMSSYDEQLEAARLASERAGNSNWKRTEGTMQVRNEGGG
jgi:hypothetical protein